LTFLPPVQYSSRAGVYSANSARQQAAAAEPMTAAVAAVAWLEEEQKMREKEGQEEHG
jgi:hypothetical protein